MAKVEGSKVDFSFVQVPRKFIFEFHVLTTNRRRRVGIQGHIYENTEMERSGIMQHTNEIFSRGT